VRFVVPLLVGPALLRPSAPGSSPSRLPGPATSVHLPGRQGLVPGLEPVQGWALLRLEQVPEPGLVPVPEPGLEQVPGLVPEPG